MNIFRFLGDMSHVVSFIFLFYRIYKYKTTAGLSLKSQELYLLVFVTRYLDLFTNFISPYNTIMKMLYLTFSGLIVYLMRMKEPWKSTYKKEEDTFFHWKFAVAPCAVLALLINQDHYSFMEILWTFSIYLEAIAILPQLIILQRYGEVENLQSNYVFSLGAYRAFYIINWVYRYSTEMYYRQYIVWISGIVQTALYADFFYYYVLSKYKGNKNVSLPK
jgi:ER lumen protein retaining receptor